MAPQQRPQLILPLCAAGRHHENGATLIEILVALLILAIGVLGMAALQIRAIKGNHSALQRSQAVMLSYSILEAMRIDKPNVMNLVYNTGAEVSGVVTAACKLSQITGTGLPADNLRHWLQTLKSTMGNANDTTTCGAIFCNNTGACRIQIRWDDSRAGGLGAQLLDTKTRL